MKRITSTKEPWIFPALMQKIQYHSHLLPHLHARQTRVIREIKRANACIGTREVAKLHVFYGLYACLARVMGTARASSAFYVSIYMSGIVQQQHTTLLFQTPDISNLTEIKIKGA